MPKALIRICVQVGKELVDEIGSCPAAAQKSPRRQFRFTVVLSPVTNAYALPGGFIYVTQPLLELCLMNLVASVLHSFVHGLTE